MTTLPVGHKAPTLAKLRLGKARVTFTFCALRRYVYIDGSRHWSLAREPHTGVWCAEFAFRHHGRTEMTVTGLPRKSAQAALDVLRRRLASCRDVLERVASPEYP